MLLITKFVAESSVTVGFAPAVSSKVLKPLSENENLGISPMFPPNVKVLLMLKKRLLFYPTLKH